MNTEKTHKIMKVAYFVNQYPKVSHSFIRREIHALERLGVQLNRYALRTNPEELVDHRDKEELNKTCYILKQPLFIFVISVLNKLLLSPGKFIKSLIISIKTGRNSERGVLRHIFYFLEACVLIRKLSKNNIDHVHAHFGTNSAAVLMLVRLLGGPTYSFTVHGPEEFDKPEFISLSEKIKYSTFVVAISSYGRSQIYRWIPYEQWNKVKVVHCGLEKEFYDIDLMSVKHKNRIVCVGRLCEQKGQQLLVEAAEKLSGEGEEFKLVLAGDGPMRKDIERLIMEKKLGDKVEITGWISSDQVRKEIIDSTALVLPSFAEGLPVVIMEAMALGKPVLTTYIAGIPELVVNNDNGWLIPAGSLDELTEGIRTIINTSDKDLERLGKNGRRKVLERHNIDTEAVKLLSFFNEIITS